MIFDAGDQPVSNRFLEKKGNSVPCYRMKIVQDSDLNYLKLENLFPLEEVRPQYDWITCYEPEDHLDELVQKIISLDKVNKDSKIGAYSFKDDSTLNRLNQLGYRNTWRISPEDHLGITNPCASVESYQAAFTIENTKQIIRKFGQSDVFIVRHVLEHSYDLPNFIKCVKTLTKDSGIIIWELPDCTKALQRGDCTMLWEEHTCYFTKNSFQNILKQHCMKLLDVYSVTYPTEDCIIAIVGNEKKSYSKQTHYATFNESRLYANYAMIVKKRGENIRSILKNWTNTKGKVAIYGAGHLAVIFVSIMEIKEYIECAIDDNPNKVNKYLPVGSIPILPSVVLYEKKIKVCLLSLNPNHHGTVREKHILFTQSGGLFLSIFPETDKYIEDIGR